MRQAQGRVSQFPEDWIFLSPNAAIPEGGRIQARLASSAALLSSPQRPQVARLTSRFLLPPSLVLRGPPSNRKQPLRDSAPHCFLNRPAPKRHRARSRLVRARILEPTSIQARDWN